jgi:DNA-binding NarL/FixJ family response regulator
MSAKEIAYRLGVSQGNVYFHKNRVMSALNMNSDAELLRYAIQQEGAN